MWPLGGSAFFLWRWDMAIHHFWATLIRELISQAPKKALRRWLPTNGRAHAVPQRSQQVAKQFLTAEQTRGLWHSLNSVFGSGPFNAEHAATRWNVFYAPGSRYALALQPE